MIIGPLVTISFLLPYILLFVTVEWLGRHQMRQTTQVQLVVTRIILGGIVLLTGFQPADVLMVLTWLVGVEWTFRRKQRIVRRMMDY